MITVILILGLILRLVNLNQSLWLDEAVQAITSRGTFSGIFSELQGDFHPPLYHFLMWVWVYLFGNGEMVMRLPSVLFGVATIYVVYLLAREILPQKKFPVPEIAALFLATAPFHIYYSQEARPYALVTFLTVLSMYFFFKEKWRGYIISTFLALYSSYFVLFVIFAQIIIVFIRRQFFLYRYIIISLLLFLPWLPMFWTQIQVGHGATQILPEWGKLVNVNFLKALPLTFIKFSIGRITIFNKTLYSLLMGILFLIYGLTISRGFFKKGKKLLLILLWFSIPILFAWVISLFIPNYQPFRLLLVLPAFYLLLAYGIANISSPIIRVVGFLFVLVVNLSSVIRYGINPYFHREDWRGVVNYIEENGNQNSLALLPSSTSHWPYTYYTQKKIPLIGVSDSVRPVDWGYFANFSSNLKSQTSNIFYIYYLADLFDPQGLIPNWLEKQKFVKIKEVNFNQIPLWIYRK